jgi:hypothetical protein
VYNSFEIGVLIREGPVSLKSAHSFFLVVVVVVFFSLLVVVYSISSAIKQKKIRKVRKITKSQLNYDRNKTKSICGKLGFKFAAVSKISAI